MFRVMHRILAGLPVAAVATGLAGQPALLAVPPTLTTLYLLVRDRIIRRRVGLAAWPSDGFARHVLVDDLGWMACIWLASLPLFALGHALRSLL